jgi:hypothetical protein
VRLLRAGYEGPLYEVCRGKDLGGPAACEGGEGADIFAVNGYADAGSQDEFCGSDACSITTIYDQSGRGNHLEPAPPGSGKSIPGDAAEAADLPTMINGHQVYGMRIIPGVGYRTGCQDCTRRNGEGTPLDDEPETIYMVTSQEDLINGCCFDYGNASTTGNNDGNGTSESVYVGGGVIWGTGSGEGPWVMADLENGLYPGWENASFQNISTNMPVPYDFVTAIVVGDTQDKNEGRGRFAIYGGDAQSGTLATMYDGIRPDRPGYLPMKKQGSVILGIASDNSNGGGGRFYEGAMVSGAASKKALDALQAALVAAGYGK